MGAFLEACRQATGSSSHFTWVEEQFLSEAGIQPEADLPIWLSASDANFLTADCSKAIKAGLTYRSLADTIRDTLAWAASRPQDYKLQAGAKLAERERGLLMAWHAERGTYAA
ncbi:MAG TPA: hypothetical protein VFK30_14115 [Anaerolineae bacterium]|nr:hypothetical protein [Anaerolineae bacterium]